VELTDADPGTEVVDGDASCLAVYHDELVTLSVVFNTCRRLSIVF